MMPGAQNTAETERFGQFQTRGMIDSARRLAEQNPAYGALRGLLRELMGLAPHSEALLSKPFL